MVSAQNRVKVVELQGIKHVCLTQEDAHKLLQIQLNYPKLELQLKKYKELVSIQEKEVSSLGNIHNNLNQQIMVLKTRNVYLQDQINSSNSWWKSAWFLVGVGFVLGIGSTIAISYSIR